MTLWDIPVGLANPSYLRRKNLQGYLTHISRRFLWRLRRLNRRLKLWSLMIRKTNKVQHLTLRHNRLLKNFHWVKILSPSQQLELSSRLPIDSKLMNLMYSRISKCSFSKAAIQCPKLSLRNQLINHQRANRVLMSPNNNRHSKTRSISSSSSTLHRKTKTKQCEVLPETLLLKRSFLLNQTPTTMTLSSDSYG